jgi:ribose transport system permease protein
MTTNQTEHAASDGAATPPATSDVPSMRRGPQVAWLAERYGLPLLLVALFVFFSVLPSTATSFSTAANLRNVAANESIIALASLAAIAPLIAGQFDVSVGAVVGMSQIAAAGAMAGGLSLFEALALALALSAAVGAVNGWLVAYLGTNSFITTLASGTLLGGLVSLYTHDQPILQGISPFLVSFGQGDLLGVPRVVWLVAAVAVVLGYGLGWTVPGRQLASVGSNPRAAALVGMPVRRIVLSSFIASALLAGLAGIVQVARTGTGDPTIGSSYTLAALSAAFLGATAVRPGRFNVAGTLIGVAFVAISVNGLTLAGAADWVDPVFNGAALTLAVAASTVFRRQRGARPNG